MDKHTDEHGTSADERGINTDGQKNQEITIDDVLSTEERTLPNGNTITIIKRTTQTEMIVPIRDPKSGEVFHTARVVLEPWATDPKKMPDHVREDAFQGCKALKEVTIFAKSITFEESGDSSSIFKNCSDDLVIYSWENCKTFKWLKNQGFPVKAMPDFFLLVSGNTKKKVQVGDYAWIVLDGPKKKSYTSNNKKVATVANNSQLTLRKPGIPASVRSIGSEVFTYCGCLRTITVAQDNPYFTSYKGVLFDKGMDKLINCPGAVTGFTLPEGVK